MSVKIYDVKGALVMIGVVLNYHHVQENGQYCENDLIPVLYFHL